MFRRLTVMTSIVVTLSISGVLGANEYLYQDDDLLCGAGFSPETYQQRIQQHAYQQRAMYAEHQRTIAFQAASEQKSLEMTRSARRVRLEKEVRKREETIAKRKAENAAKGASSSATLQTAGKSLKSTK